MQYIKCHGCSATLKFAHRGSKTRVRCPRCRAVTAAPTRPDDTSKLPDFTEPLDVATQTAELDDPELNFPDIRDSVDPPTDESRPGFAMQIDHQLSTVHLVVETKPPVLANYEGVIAALKTNRISHGIAFDTIKVACMSLDYPEDLKIGQSFLIAQGVPAAVGDDGTIEYLVDVTGENQQATASQNDQDGRVDYKAIAGILTVNNGAPLAQITKPTMGTPGVGLDGKPTPALPGQPVQILPGEGVRFSPEDNRYYATRDGRPLLTDSNLTVLDIYEVAEDVDMSIGHIAFNGHVIVRGSVLDDFEIKCKSIEVHGTVGAARITCSGDAMLHGGVNGNQNGRLRIGGHCSAKYLNEAELFVNRDLTVERGVSNCQLACGSVVFADRVIGGRAVALKGFEINYLGSDLGVSTHLISGRHPLREKLTARLSTEMALLESLQKDPRSAVSNHSVQDGSAGPNPADLNPEEQTKDPLEDTNEDESAASAGTKEIWERICGLQTKLASLEEKESALAIKQVNIGSQLFADVIVTLGEQTREFKTPKGGKQSIRLDENGAIDIGPYKRRPRNTMPENQS
ncbi:MAG: FapA family protein [Myxococcota bacterium]|nr:FapA family protein [Myxococcota bacterium]